MLLPWEAAELVRQKTGIRLKLTTWTDDRTIGLADDGSWVNKLYGPYLAEDGETRIFINHIQHAGDATGPYMQLLVQDCEGDFLNSTADGAERYNVGVIH